MNEIYHYWQMCSAWEFMLSAGFVWAVILVIRNICRSLIMYPIEYYEMRRWQKRNATTEITPAVDDKQIHP